MLLVSLLSAFVLLCMFVPSVRACLLAMDDSLDAHEAGMALVAYRTSTNHTISFKQSNAFAIRQTISREWAASEHGTAYHASP